METAHPDDKLFTEASRHSIAAGGKRFRALLVLLAAQFGDPKDPRVLQAAVAIELTQLAETIGPRPGQDPLDHYMHVITEKTGSLIATSGQFGALFSGAPAEVAARIAAACEQLGVAWQLSDDVIDIASDSAQSGKTPGTDLRQGVRTLPVLYALRSVAQSGPMQSPADARLRWLLEEADLTDEDLLKEALTLLRGHHAMKEARADVLNWVQEARTTIRTLPDAPARGAFLALCDFVEKRT